MKKRGMRFGEEEEGMLFIEMSLYLKINLEKICYFHKYLFDCKNFVKITTNIK